jgi:hypothetical protein
LTVAGLGFGDRVVDAVDDGGELILGRADGGVGDEVVRDRFAVEPAWSATYRRLRYNVMLESLDTGHIFSIMFDRCVATDLPIGPAVSGRRRFPACNRSAACRRVCERGIARGLLGLLGLYSVFAHECSNAGAFDRSTASAWRTVSRARPRSCARSSIDDRAARSLG